MDAPQHKKKLKKDGASSFSTTTAHKVQRVAGEHQARHAWAEPDKSGPWQSNAALRFDLQLPNCRYSPIPGLADLNMFVLSATLR